jgi:predicted TIM-barrel fold metal-dependent hydrolase
VSDTNNQGEEAMSVVLESTSRSAELRAQFDHPVVDGDGHWLEPIPILTEFLADVGGAPMADDYLASHREAYCGWYDMTVDERLAHRQLRPLTWQDCGNTIDRATAMLPKLMYERLDEFGIDVSVVYPSMGLGAVHMQDEERRRSFCRAMNLMTAELFAPYRDRLVPVACIPSFTPDEAIEELEFAVEELGLRAMYMSCAVKRLVTEEPATPFQPPYYIDSLGLDSPYDYDPLWAKAVELGVAISTHAGGMGWPDRTSVTNSVYNHIGHFANANHAAAKGLFLGGVTKRFPGLKFAFLEGGAGWAANLLVDLIGHWEKRSLPAMFANLNPANIDLERLAGLIREYGSERHTRHLDAILAAPGTAVGATADELVAREERERDHGAMYMDDYAALGADVTEDDLVRLFAENFYFGCEADDATVRWAFDEVAGLNLKPIFSSDISHWDVTHMNETVEEAYELVEHGLITPEQFRKFVFEYPVELRAGMAPDFFDGTRIAGEVSALTGG